ncbi:MAG: pantetheine-phosphate adenylyltransferase [Paludibacter sp.]|jgi:pantetheine-phosphate adenylyltransferase|nr:pantetheine-phosphate adenylyltransferase [Paludibacter sp.]
MKRAIFPGTFDPFTIGHYTIVQRGLKVFDEIIIGIGVNQLKKTLLTVEQRLDIINQTFADEKRVKIEVYDCLTVDFAKKVEADFILRGLRTVSDFEYERTIADTNRILTGIETIILFTEADYAHISSTMARDLLSYGKDISDFLPPNVKNISINN